jgi:hypothetical protein
MGSVMSDAEEVRLEGAHCSLVIRRPAPRVVTIVFEGTDVGELGDAPFRELGNDLALPGAARLFIDARNASGASIEVSGQWATWLNENAARLAEVNMLTSSQFIRITASFVSRFSGLGDRMRVHTDPATFEHALSDARRS